MTDIDLATLEYALKYSSYKQLKPLLAVSGVLLCIQQGGKVHYMQMMKDIWGDQANFSDRLHKEAFRIWEIMLDDMDKDMADRYRLLDSKLKTHTGEEA